MFEQVYYHKTTRCFERILENLFKRLKYLHREDNEKFQKIKFIDDNLRNLLEDPEDIEAFLALDDFYILTQIRIWSAECEDEILKELCKCIIERKPFYMFKEDDSGRDLLTREEYKIL